MEQDFSWGDACSSAATWQHSFFIILPLFLNMICAIKELEKGYNICSGVAHPVSGGWKACSSMHPEFPW